MTFTLFSMFGKSNLNYHFSMTKSMPWHAEEGGGLRRMMPSLKFEGYDVMIVRFSVKYPTISLAPSVLQYWHNPP